MSANAARRLSRMFHRISVAISAGKDPLSDLDGAIGDADHGIGASTGPLYATAFRKAAQTLKQDEALSAAGQAAIIEAMTSGIRERGKGQRGDKTMLDAWIPATEAAAAARDRQASVSAMWDEILEAADAGARSTRSMVATRGRAARLGERSLGHIDPGAASAVVIIKAMRDTFTENEPAE